MPPKKAVTDAEKPAKKTKSGGRTKKVSAYNKFMQTELARLKETEPNTPHLERFKMATQNWKTAKENPKAEA
ncbi:hypothetical protein SISNIDRAFT_516334 [Sistotremastrum niveocremeum HHB9708]|uniref:YABBY protein C-terminal domain-containing protein n=1 Tax=Sistotremastrum niveocremeum HHB9708 TaxID=1314777 RepID=A0A164SMR4_9AGAM|nr:hypothetical protein SISNIDRAFT_516334 [Sistotremastrum niveocremeum HHB9708]